ncbi:UDP-N-acetylglucosamine 2-epimerase [Azospirillum sp.]|uniref:UDP-N-acetylglucosamine 2-epimerase n=1 Tax=Azospirillum sp. TaxID=34012 RepID=UPI002D6E7B67|nr:UDP-N-acetylglucosamine 2-epimerase [Azospirillum sp.]HYD70580.1 UDP-N-acetylglucosamine 2-epimerase [Azospirillum sp.]
MIVTTHRRENHDRGLLAICDAVAALADRHPGVRFLVPVHPNPNVSTPVRARLSGYGNVELSPPLAYGDFIRHLAACWLVITDSGGLQEECPHLGKPLLIARTTTERPQAVEAGAAWLVGTDADAIFGAADRLMMDPDLYGRMAVRRPLFGDGQAARRIADILVGSSR